MIEAARLTKRLGGRVVVEDASFQCAPGTVTGFLGPNGEQQTLRPSTEGEDPACLSPRPSVPSVPTGAPHARRRRARGPLRALRRPRRARVAAPTHPTADGSARRAMGGPSTFRLPARARVPSSRRAPGPIGGRADWEDGIRAS
jgi:hypothetical protein